MDGTRRARLIALAATLVLGLTLFAAALLATAQHGGGSPVDAGTVAPTPVTILTDTPLSGASVVMPRPTPPPTNPAAGTGAVPLPVPSAATTVGTT